MSSSASDLTQFPCKSCGAALHFTPGTTHLTCPYCGTINDIPSSPTDHQEVIESDFEAELARLESAADTEETLTIHCDQCGAETTLAPGQTAGRCPFCGNPIVAQARSKRLLKPQYLLPFKVPDSQAGALFRSWLASLWFAPSDLKKYADREGIRGVYTPAWTYDCRTRSNYSGERGDDYWDTETYTTTENGQTVTRTREVRRTRWYSVSGRVRNEFDDLLVMAAHSLPAENLERLQPWDLPALVPYRDEYLAGFQAESYQIPLPEGFELAKSLMLPTIEDTIRTDIGGDHQRISDIDTGYFEITYKHLLLPVWISSFRYREKTYRFLINARTGEINGQRPYSAWKIAFLILTLLIVFATIALLAANHR